MRQLLSDCQERNIGAAAPKPPPPQHVEGAPQGGFSCPSGNSPSGGPAQPGRRGWAVPLYEFAEVPGEFVHPYR